MTHLVEGKAAARVRVVIYEDLQCGDCTRLRRMLDEILLPRFASLAAFEHRDFPLPKHSWARQAAVAARRFGAANPAQEIAFRRLTLETFKQISPDTLQAHLDAFAAASGAVLGGTEAEAAAAVEADYQAGLAQGVTKTPTVFVNGRAFIEVFTAEEIANAIEEEQQSR